MLKFRHLVYLLYEWEIDLILFPREKCFYVCWKIVQRIPRNPSQFSRHFLPTNWILLFFIHYSYIIIGWIWSRTAIRRTRCVVGTFDETISAKTKDLLTRIFDDTGVDHEKKFFFLSFIILSLSLSLLFSGYFSVVSLILKKKIFLEFKGWENWYWTWLRRFSSVTILKPGENGKIFSNWNFSQWFGYFWHILLRF